MRNTIKYRVHFETKAISEIKLIDLWNDLIHNVGEQPRYKVVINELGSYDIVIFTEYCKDELFLRRFVSEELAYNFLLSQWRTVLNDLDNGFAIFDTEEQAIRERNYL